MNLNAAQIEQITGKKAPLNLLDEVTELTMGQKITALKAVSSNESYFGGHFPGNPVMPGVLIIETFVQTAQVLQKDEHLVLQKIRNVRFRKMVRPGDLLTIEVARKQAEGQVFEAKALLGEKAACTAQLIFS